jgi:hypothetical protein
MQRTIFFLCVFGFIRVLPAADQPANFAGTWILGTQKSDRRYLAKGPLVIVQTAKEIITSNITADGKLAVDSFRPDGEKHTLRSPNGSEASIQAKWKGNALEVTNENIYQGGKAKATRRYSLSKDGKTLNIDGGFGGYKLVFHRSDTVPDSAPPSGSPVAQSQVLNSQTYAEAALQLVRKERFNGAIRLEVIGKPVLKPERLSLHASAPDAIVLINLHDGESVREQALVMFRSNGPAATVFSPKKSPFSGSLIGRTELQKVANELDSFFSVALDVSRGSERFYPYLPDDIRSLLKFRDRKFRMYMPPAAVDPSWRDKLSEEAASRGAKLPALEDIEGWNDKLSDDELRRFVALQLDVLIQQSLLAIGGYVNEVMEQAARQRPQVLASNPRDFIKILEEAVSQNKRLLEKAGYLDPEHLSLTSGYMKRFMGQGFLVKEVSKPDPCPCFQSSLADAALYVTSIGSPSGGPALHFGRTGDSLRIICAAIP